MYIFVNTYVYLFALINNSTLQKEQLKEIIKKVIMIFIKMHFAFVYAQENEVLENKCYENAININEIK